MADSTNQNDPPGIIALKIGGGLLVVGIVALIIYLALNQGIVSLGSTVFGTVGSWWI